ncbi:MAG: GtrA family protein [Clostridiales bacterium]|nr:GtrA family protein [Clostridiales bacterium]
MKIIKKLFIFIKKLYNNEVIRYLFFGGLTTVVSLGSYWLFSYLLSVEGEISTLNIQISNFLSWIFAVAFAYITNKIFVFKSKSFKPNFLLREISSFVSARVFSLVVEAVWLLVTTTLLGLNDKIAKLIGQIIVVIINYVLSKLFIFKKKEKSQ